MRNCHILPVFGLLVLLASTNGYNMSDQVRDFLEPHLNSGLGIVLRADNGLYIRNVLRELPYLEAVSEIKDQSCRFNMEITEDNHLRLYQGQKDRKNYLYLVDMKAADNQLVERLTMTANFFTDAGGRLSSVKSSSSRIAEFKVYLEDGKLILRTRKDNFVSRTEWRAPRAERIVANHRGIDDSCKFTVETGSVVPVTETILNITWHDASNLYASSANGMNALTVETRTIDNLLSSVPVSKQFSFKKTMTTSQETGWETSFGIHTGLTYSASFSFFGVTASSQLSLDINYNGKRHANMGSSKAIEITEETSVEVPAGKKMLVKFIVDENKSKSKFTATVKRTSDLGTTIFDVDGTWQGVFAFNSMTTVEDISDV